MKEFSPKRTIRDLEVAEKGMTISARVYLRLEDEVAKTGDKKKSARAMKILDRVIREPKALHSLTNFVEIRHQFLNQDHSGVHKK